MKIFNIKYIPMINLVITLFFISPINAQELSVGADVVSRYIWRGIESGGHSPSIQPTIEFSTSGFALGVWGALPTANPDALEEMDIYANYSFNLNNLGSFSLGFTDYMFPNSGTKIGNFNNYDDEGGPGAHFIEANVIYSGPESLPIYLSVNVFFYNLENNPIYFELGYSTSVSNTPLDVFIGGTPGEDGMYYGVNNFSIINTGIKVSKEIKFTDSFSLPVFGSVILNPASEDLYYVLGISL